MLTHQRISAISERKTSYAKEALEASADNALERYGFTSEAFNSAREDDPSQSLDNPQLEERGDGSRMVANDQPELAPKPGPEIARPVDRESFDQRWDAEQQRSDDAHQERSGDFERGDDYSR